ncbi:MAG: nucleoside deaminase [Opitutae bacterium]|nr:nucleoside deaminase [Opitutae bacterium]
MSHGKFMREAIKLADEGMHSGRGGPFGCVIVRSGKIVGRGNNRVTSTNDPTAHAEVTAIRDACARLKTFQLTDCELYTSCEPCPMCLSAIYWARIPAIWFANSRQDAADIGFDDDFIYRQIPLPLEKRAIKIQQVLRAEGLATFKGWAAKSDKVKY